MFLSLHIIIQGIVQGVNCRYQVKNYTDQHQLVGSVQNLNEFDKVEIYIQGKENSINEFITWLKSNPGYIKLNEVKILNKEKIDKLNYNNFQIIY